MPVRSSIAARSPPAGHGRLGRKTVFKYIWPPGIDRTSFVMPREAEILCVREQQDTVCIWARVVEGRAPERRDFVLCGTGHDAPDLDHRYIGTAFLHGGTLVLHVFEAEAPGAPP